MPSNAVAPSVTPPSPYEWPQTIKSISGITNAREATIHCTSHGFTTEDQSITTVLFKQVQGMLPINGLPGVIQTVIDADYFTVNINTTQFPIYRGSGVISIVTGQPPIEQQGAQYFNTPFQNIANTE
jgi:hypothetical protein